MKSGDIVQSTLTFGDEYGAGIIIETDVNMWGEEVVPSGAKILWACGDISVVYEDEVEVIYEYGKREVMSSLQREGMAISIEYDTVTVLSEGDVCLLPLPKDKGVDIKTMNSVKDDVKKFYCRFCGHTAFYGGTGCFSCGSSVQLKEWL